MVSAAAVVEALQQADPEAVAPSKPQESQDGKTANPSLESSGGGFGSTGTPVESTIARDPADGYSLSTDTGTLTIKPAEVDERAGAGQLVAGGDAVAYPNTGQASDTLVRPQPDGVESFTALRNETAPETSTFEVDLDGDEELRKTDEGTVQIIDPSPDKTLADVGKKPDDDEVTTAELDQLKAEGKAEAGDETSAARSEQDLATASDTAKDLLADEADAPAEVAEGTAPPELDNATPEATGDVPDSPAEVADNASQAAEQSLAKTAETTQHAQQADNAAEQGEQQREDQADLAKLNAPQVVAEIQAPTATDADGKQVPASLSVDGDSVTLTVEHQDEDFAYPIAADPYVTLVHRYDEWVCCRPTAHTVSYISEWYIADWRYIGKFFGSSTWSVPNTPYANGWYWVYLAGTGWAIMNPWMHVSPIYYPLLAPRWSTYTYWTNDSYVQTSYDLERVWIDQDDGELEDDEGYYRADTPYYAPGDWCRGGVVGVASGYSERRRYLVIAPNGVGVRPYRVSLSSSNYDCGNGRARTYFDLWYDTRAFPKGSPKLVQFQFVAQRKDGTSRATPISDLPSGQTPLCCHEIGQLPKIESGPPRNAATRMKEARVPIGPNPGKATGKGHRLTAALRYAR